MSAASSPASPDEAGIALLAPGRGRIAVLGSGASTGVPWLQCLVGPPSRCCAVCADCRRNPAATRNVRNNPSALVSVPLPPGAPRGARPAAEDEEAPATHAHVMIDAGKTMRAACARWFPPLGCRALAAVVLTHPHADAFLGLDDLRDLSPRVMLPVYLSEACFAVVRRSFGYLVPPASIAPRSARNAALGYGLGDEAASTDTAAAPAPGATPATVFVSMIEWRVFRPWEPFVIPEAGGLVVTPVPVSHGNGPQNLSMAFELGAVLAPPGELAAAPADAAAAPGTLDPAPPTAASAVAPAAAAAAAALATTDTAATFSSPRLSPWRGSRVLYVSDVSALSRAARALFRARRTDLLLLDLLNYRPYSTHFSALQAVNCAVDLRAGVTRFVGINHALDHALEHEKLQDFGRALGTSAGAGADEDADANAPLADAGGALDLGLAHDGLVFELDFAPVALDDLRADLGAVRGAAAAEAAARRDARRARPRGVDAAGVVGPGASAGPSDGEEAEDSAHYDYLLPARPEFAEGASATEAALGPPWRR